MNDREKYFKLFGRLNSLADRIPWTTAVSHLVEWLTWNTRYILGVSKAKYAEQIIEWTDEAAVLAAAREEKKRYVHQKLKELERNIAFERYAPYKYTIASSREALRRTTFFSEAYLNEEFDVFWTLVSNKYLDAFYRQFTHVTGGGQWSTHGDSGLFQASTGIRNMEIDNLSYNETEALLVANELKLGGQKNPDQILKYTWMFKELRDKKLIVPQSRFLFLFISDVKQDRRWEDLIEAEVSYCKNNSKSTARAACQPDVIAAARSAEKASMTWIDVIKFNENYSAKLDSESQQVEIKLLSGFNDSLKAKAVMQGKSTNRDDIVV
jgi:hypothetical protein